MPAGAAKMSLVGEAGDGRLGAALGLVEELRAENERLRALLGLDGRDSSAHEAAWVSSVARLSGDAAAKLAESLRPINAGPAVTLADPLPLGDRHHHR